MYFLGFIHKNRLQQIKYCMVFIVKSSIMVITGIMEETHIIFIILHNLVRAKKN